MEYIVTNIFRAQLSKLQLRPLLILTRFYFPINLVVLKLVPAAKVAALKVAPVIVFTVDAAFVRRVTAIVEKVAFRC